MKVVFILEARGESGLTAHLNFHAHYSAAQTGCTNRMLKHLFKQGSRFRERNVEVVAV